MKQQKTSRDLEALKKLMATGDWRACYQMLKAPEVQLLLNDDANDYLATEVCIGVAENTGADFQADFGEIWASAKQDFGGVALAERALAIRTILVKLKSRGELNLDLAETAVSQFDDSFSEQTMTMVSAFGALAQEAGERKDTERQLLYWNRALETEEKILGPEHPDRFWTLVLSAFAEEQSGCADKAFGRLKVALKIAEDHHDLIETDDRLLVLQALGFMLSETDRLEETEKYLRAAIELTEHNSEVLESPTAYVRMISTLAHLLAFRQSNPGAAKLVYERLLNGKFLSALDDLDEMPILISNYAQCLLDLESYQEARHYLEWSKSLLEKAGGCDSGTMSTVLNGIGLSHLECGDYDDAAKYFESAAKLGDVRQDPVPLQNLAICLDRSGRPGRARRVWDKLMSDLRGSDVAADHMASIVFEFAKHLGENDEHKACVSAFSQAIEYARTAYGEKSEKVAEIYEVFASYHGNVVHDVTSAIRYLRMALEVYGELGNEFQEKLSEVRSELEHFLLCAGYISEEDARHGLVSRSEWIEKSTEHHSSETPRGQTHKSRSQKGKRRILS